MNLIVCLDDRNGMLFANRRQSRDEQVCKKILQLVAGHTLWMNNYSAKLFSDIGGKICTADDFLEKSGDGEFCFVENRDILPYWEKIEKVIIFRWNRHYPSDTKFPVDLLKDNLILVETSDFPGKSHEKITMEVYSR